jgi:hypothetical protein
MVYEIFHLWFVWITVRGQTLGRLVVCDNSVLKQLFKAKKKYMILDNIRINLKQL